MLLSVWLLAITLSHAQIFNDSSSIVFENVQQVKYKVADINNDASMDIVVLKSGNGISTIERYFGQQVELLLSDTTLNILDIQVADLNNDNHLDLILVTKAEGREILQVLFQSENRVFNQWSIVDTTSVLQYSIGDINKDGVRDILYSNNENELKAKFFDEGIWNDSVADLPDFNVQTFVHFDANNKMGDELIFSDVEKVNLVRWDSGWSVVDSVIAEFPTNNLSFGDIDDNGFFDLGVYHNDSYHILLSNSEPITIEVGQYINTNSWLYDFNSDGRTDFLFTGILEDSTAVLKLFLKEVNGQFILGELKLLERAQSFEVSDIDQDGDLDFFCLQNEENGIVLKILDNVTPATNNGPSVTPQHYAFVEGRKVTLYWTKAADDHTKKENLTYETFIGGYQGLKADIVGPHLFLDSLSMQISAFGNAGLNTKYELNYELPLGICFYGIKTIDNALYAEKGSGSCATGLFAVCDNQEVISFNPCDGDELIIESENETAYFSVNQGFLGITNRLAYQVDGEDKILTSVAGSTNCEDYKIYEIVPLNQLNVFEEEEVIYCLNDEIPFELATPIQVDSVKWIFNNRVVSKDSLLSFSPQVSGLLKLELYNGNCAHTDSINLKVGNPILNIIKPTYHINPGGSAQFEIEASNYETLDWTPSTNLNNSEILTPVASPEEDETYTITIIDALGCEVSGTVQVIINQTTFVPDLFSPNGDGKNDRLLLYDLKHVNSVKFSIYNRSGAKVFESTNLDELTFEGWDGTTNGKEQPVGLYFWRIEGQTKSNTALKANGKSEGVIYLMR